MTATRSVYVANTNDALRQTRRKLTGKVYHWKNCWAFEVENG